MKGTENMSVPVYFQPHLDEKIKKIRALDFKIGNHGESFVFITDIHWDTSEKHSFDLIRYVQNRCNAKKIFSGGDIACSNGDDGQTLEQFLPEVEPFLEYVRSVGMEHYMVVGNHDTNNNSGKNRFALTEAQLYALFMGKNDQNEHTYYCVDNKAMKIRYIILDDSREYAWTEDQAAWLRERITELTPDWTVLCFAHISYLIHMNDYYNFYLGEEAKPVVETLDSVYGKGATIAGFITGHIHRDVCKYSEKGYPIITTCCDADEQSDCWGGLKMTRRTRTEHCFDVIHIDTAERKLHFTRIGAGGDREFDY